MKKEEILNEIFECNREILMLASKERTGIQGKSSTDKVIGILRRAEGDVNPTDICRELGVTTPRITTILNSMEKEGLIERKMSPDDRRKVIVTLTEKAIRKSEETKKDDLECFGKVYEKVGQDDMKAVIRYMKAFKEVMEEQ